jgi:hypothetical protein
MDADIKEGGEKSELLPGFEPGFREGEEGLGALKIPSDDHYTIAACMKAYYGWYYPLLLTDKHCKMPSCLLMINPWVILWFLPQANASSSTLSFIR